MDIEIRCYRFSCPECGMSDGELGHLATEDEVHCLVCLIDDQRQVVLRRWFTEPATTPVPPAAKPGRSRPGRR